MKKMMAILFAVIVISGVSVVHGGTNLKGTSDFNSSFSQTFRNKYIGLYYYPGSIYIRGDYVYTGPGNGKLEVKMDNNGGAAVKLQLRGTDGSTGTVNTATGTLKKDDIKSYNVYVSSRLGEYFYGYIDYRGASTAPDVYIYEVTKE